MNRALSATPRRLLAATATVAALAAVTLSGCGGGNTPGASQSTTKTTSTGPHKAPARKQSY
jgi:hypothetical protein